MFITTTSSSRRSIQFIKTVFANGQFLSEMTDNVLRPLFAMATTPPGSALADGDVHVMHHMTYFVFRTRWLADGVLDAPGHDNNARAYGIVNNGSVGATLVWPDVFHTGCTLVAFDLLARHVMVGVVSVTIHATVMTFVTLVTDPVAIAPSIILVPC